MRRLTNSFYDTDGTSATILHFLKDTRSSEFPLDLSYKKRPDLEPVPALIKTGAVPKCKQAHRKRKHTSRENNLIISNPRETKSTQTEFRVSSESLFLQSTKFVEEEFVKMLNFLCTCSSRRLAKLRRIDGPIIGKVFEIFDEDRKKELRWSIGALTTEIQTANKVQQVKVSTQFSQQQLLSLQSELEMQQSQKFPQPLAQWIQYQNNTKQSTAREVFFKDTEKLYQERLFASYEMLVKLKLYENALNSNNDED